MEIVDISAENEKDFPVEQIQWADACLIVYSITEKSSFDYAVKSLCELKALQSAPSAFLVGNKADLDHLREVSFSYIITRILAIILSHIIENRLFFIYIEKCTDFHAKY